jgi:DNA-binding CsgD family transcriptional regulator/tetratricopeptide (TPR) repeat protein
VTDLVLGRLEELRQLGLFLDSLVSGPAGCVLQGPAGIGKTALWRDGVEAARARSYRVLRCAPAEVEGRLSFASLADLLSGVEEGAFACLPAPLRGALDVALLKVDKADFAAEPRAVATAAVSLLEMLASSAPVVVAVDDVQWVDRPSARVLEFAARRVQSSRVGFLLSVRTPTEDSSPLSLERSLPSERLRHIPIGPLSAGALHQLIRERLGQAFGRATLLRIHRVTNGNPFFGLELARSLARAGVPAAGEPLPVPDDLRQLVAERLRRLPRTTRRVLLFAATMPNPTVEELRGAMCEAANVSPERILAQLARAEAAGVIVMEGEAVRFKHPLFASAVSAMCTFEEKRRTHRRLAALATNVEQRARYLALCTDQPTKDVAGTIADGARAARRRGAPETAAELTELAIALTPEDQAEERDRRLLELGSCLGQAGDADRARDVLLGVAAAPGPLRSRALLDVAALDYWGGSARAAVERCEQALAAATGERAQEAACHGELAVYCEFDAARSERHARAAVQLLTEAGGAADPDTLTDALLAMARADLMLGRGLPMDVVERAFESVALASHELGRSRVGTMLGQWLKYVDDFDGSRGRLENALIVAVEEGDESSKPNILMHLAQLECWSGNWELALRYAEESVELGEQGGQGFGGPPAVRALVAAHLGDVDGVRAAVNEGLAEVEPSQNAFPLYMRVLGFLELSVGDVSSAERHLSVAREVLESMGILEPGVYRLHADLVEALAGSGQLDRAEAVLDEFEQRAQASPIPWSLATSARSRGLLLAARGELDLAERTLRQALREHKRLPMPFERARTLFVLGLLQRRRNERRRSRETLEQARAIFEELGARLWSERTRRELRPVGGRPTDRETLTPAEQRVAELAAGGLTNREVASLLSISPKTVEASLARAYRKLDIHSRAELGAKFAAREGPATASGQSR